MTMHAAEQRTDYPFQPNGFGKRLACRCACSTWRPTTASSRPTS
jgi:hypothetical protein